MRVTVQAAIRPMMFGVILLMLVQVLPEPVVTGHELGCSASTCHVAADDTSSSEEESGTSTPLKILLITGGCCHDYSTQKQLIKNGLESRANCVVTVVQQGGTSTNSKIEVYEDEDWADGFDVVIHDECFADVKDQEWVDRILKPHREGVPAVVLHCAMHCYRTGGDEWFEFCGVTSRRHGAHYPHEVLNNAADHPVMQTFPAGWMNPAGELYWIEKVWPNTTVLATAKNREKGNSEPCVWTNDFGGTRVFGSTLGHHNETVEHPVFMEMLTRGTLWAAGALDESMLKEIQPRMVPVNLALGKPCQASSEETGKNNLAPLAVDGNPRTRWCAVDSSAPQSLTVDLEAVETLTGGRLVWEQSGVGYRYAVEASLDGSEWLMVADRRETATTDHVFDAENLEARYIRITFLGSSTGAWGSLWEVELHGDEFRIEEEAGTRSSEEIEYLARIKTPPEFEATIFAAPPAVQYPVFVCTAPDGAVYVSVDRNGSLGREPHRGAIYRLRDVDGDGRADEVKLFVDDIDSPRGLVWDHDRLYCMHPPHLSALIDHDGDGICDERKVLVEDIAFTFKDRPADHTSNGVTMGIDGWLYLAIGDFGFMDATGADGRRLQLRGGGVVRVRPDGSGLQLYSRGTRNILEVAMDPLLNGFARDNTNDGGGWDIRLHHFSGLEDHGYPRRFLNFTDEVIAPIADYGGGSGCGAVYVDEAAMPERWNRALLTADWGRSIVFHHSLSSTGATFTDQQSTFAEIPRVTDIDTDFQGNLFLSSWEGATFNYNGDEVGYLIKLAPKGNPGRHEFTTSDSSDMQLLDSLRSGSHRRRVEAQRELLRRGLSENTYQLVLDLMNSTQASLESRVAALFTVKQAATATLQDDLIAASAARELRPFVIRALADFQGYGTPWSNEETHHSETNDLKSEAIELIVAAVNDEMPRTRLEASVALARIAKEVDSRRWIPLLADPEPRVRHTAVNALIEIEAVSECLEAWDNAASDSQIRTGAMRVLQEIHNSECVGEVVRRFRATEDAAVRAQWFAVLCRLYFEEGDWTGKSWGTRPDTRGPYYQPETWEMTEQVNDVLRSAVTDASLEELPGMVDPMAKHRIEIAEVTENLVARLVDQPEYHSLLIRELGRVGTMPAAAQSFLEAAATNDSMAPPVRASAIEALVKVGTDDAICKSIEAAQMIDLDPNRSDVESRLKQVLLRPRLLGRHLDVIVAEENESEDSVQTWRLAAMMTCLKDQRLVESHGYQIASQIESDWANSDKRASVLRAALLADYRAFSREALVSIESDDPAVAKLAQLIVQRWGIEENSDSQAPKVESMKPEEVLAAIDEAAIDRVRGQRVFVRLACANCHTVAGEDKLRGPHLPQVAKTYTKTQIAESILEPSKSIAQGFSTQLFVMDDGKSYVGFVVFESDDRVIIRDKDGEQIELLTDAIEDRVQQTTSVMPSGLADKSTIEDFAALVDYVNSLGELGAEQDE